MQRSRRRKLLEQARRDPMFVEAVKARDTFRASQYQGTSRHQRRAAAVTRPAFAEALAKFVEQTK